MTQREEALKVTTDMIDLADQIWWIINHNAEDEHGEDQRSLGDLPEMLAELILDAEQKSRS